MEKLLNCWKLSKKLFLRKQAIRAPLLEEEEEEEEEQEQVQPKRSKFQAFLTFCCDCIHQFISNRQKSKGKGEDNQESDDPSSNSSLTPLFGREMDLMKERFSKLLLGEDMSGGGNGVSSALALSNALTTLAASVFGELWKLEPLSEERKARWRREVGWLVSVTDYIVEFVASQQTGKDGSIMEIMVTQQRKDLLVNIPALRKLDSMLLDTLDNFKNDQGYRYLSKDVFESNKGVKRGDKRWLPTFKIPQNGLSQESRLFLQKQKDAATQILEECMAINARTLSDIEVPETYMETLPKNGKSSLGESIYKYITDDEFDPHQLLSTLDLSSEPKVVDLMNRIEASIVIWKRKMNLKDSKSSWGLAVSSEKRELFEERAETILLMLKHQFPGLPQSSLDTAKIQHNKDVGLAIIESYSRALESSANAVLSSIEDVLYADSMTQDPGVAGEKPKKSSSATTPTLFDFMGWGYEPPEANVK